MCQTYLVAGGYDRERLVHYNSGDLSSTEILTETAAKWKFSGQLPTPRNGLRGANIDGRILMTGNMWRLLISENCLALLYMKLITKCSGGYDGDYLDEIVEFSPTSGEWTVLDNMMEARGFHAVSVISSNQIMNYCWFQFSSFLGEINFWAEENRLILSFCLLMSDEFRE